METDKRLIYTSAFPYENGQTGTTITDFCTPKELTFLFLMDSTDTAHISKQSVEVKNNRKGY